MKNRANRITGRLFQEANEHEAAPAEAHHFVSTEQLVQQIKETADKLIRDQANRGDVKLLNTALKELRTPSKSSRPTGIAAR